MSRWRSLLGIARAEKRALPDPAQKPLQPGAGSAADRRRRVGSALVLAAPVAVVTLLHLLLFPPGWEVSGQRLEVGGVAFETVRAPFTFFGPRPQRELDAARKDAASRVDPVFRPVGGAALRSRQRLAEFIRRVERTTERDIASLPAGADPLAEWYPAMPQTSRVLWSGGTDRGPLERALQATVQELLAAGIVDMLPQGTYRFVQVIDAATGEETARPAETVVPVNRVEERTVTLARAHGLDEAAAHAVALAAEQLVSANLSFDDETTEARRVAAAATVPEDREYARDEVILEAGARVTRDHRAIVEALETERARRAVGGDRGRLARQIVGRALLVLAILGGLLFLSAAARGFARPRRSHVLLACTLLAMFLGLSALVHDAPSLGPVAVPIALLAMLATVLMGAGDGLRTTLAGMLMMTLVPATTPPVIVLWTAVAVAAVRSVRRVRNRNQFYKALAAVALTCAVCVAALGLSGATPSLWWDLLLGVGSVVASTALAVLLLPLLEALFGVTTELTLLELSDLNHPLLRRMILESPGTFHHSQVVGQLAEAGAHAIGASSLLARVGANYHDIGKMLKPRYYVENQSGENAHDDLSPSMSALVIAAHVKDGVELGRQWGLPDVVTDFIPEHHGTTVMQYFYHKALERDDGAAINVDDFRYPGPKPRSKETAIVMLADGAEAATRSLRRPSPSRIREMVRKVFERRMGDGELDECGLTLKELARVREAFIPILVSVHHERVAYPGQVEHEDRKEKEHLEARARARRRGADLASWG